MGKLPPTKYNSVLIPNSNQTSTIMELSSGKNKNPRNFPQPYKNITQLMLRDARNIISHLSLYVWLSGSYIKINILSTTTRFPHEIL